MITSNSEISAKEHTVFVPILLLSHNKYFRLLIFIISRFISALSKFGVVAPFATDNALVVIKALSTERASNALIPIPPTVHSKEVRTLPPKRIKCISENFEASMQLEDHCNDC